MPVLVEETLLRHHDVRSGRWVEVVADGGRAARRSVTWRAGTTGNRLDPTRRVRRREVRVRIVTGAVAVESTWPVPDVRTNRIGEVVEDLADDLAAAGVGVAEGFATIRPALEAVLDGVEHSRRDRAAPASDGATDPVRATAGSLWSGAYRLLTEPVGLGARIRSLPLVLEPMLRAPDPRTAAQRHLGPTTTRPLVRALAAALVPDPDGRLVLEPVLVALMAVPVCGPEQLSALLATRPHRPGAVAFDLADVDRARAAFADVPARRLVARLRRSLTEEHGTAELAHQLAAWHPPLPPAPPPRPAPAPQAALRRGADHDAAAPDRGPGGPARPATPEPTGTAAVLTHPRRLATAAGRTVDGLEVVLPRTADDLLAWGRTLSNCLGGYRHAVAGGQTHIVGLRSGGRLVYALEITPGGVVRQLEAADNRAPSPLRERRILADLRELGVLTADGRDLIPF